jgi:hypothetical protein
MNEDEIKALADAALNKSDKTSELIAETKELQRLLDFKTLVHEFLDRAGVPKNPPGKHADEGFRVGQRLQWLVDEKGKVELILEALRRNV